MKGITAWIPGWEGEYQITTTGEVISWRSGNPKTLKPVQNELSGHKSITLCNENKTEKYYLHRLVYATIKRKDL